jgi:hypothetical protein
VRHENQESQRQNRRQPKHKTVVAFKFTMPLTNKASIGRKAALGLRQIAALMGSVGVFASLAAVMSPMRQLLAFVARCLMMSYRGVKKEEGK